MRLTAQRARGLIAALGVGALAACADMPANRGDGVVAGPLSPMPQPDTCGAAPYAYLLGQPGVALERVLIMREIRIRAEGDVSRGEERPARINFHLEDIPQPEGARPTRNTTRIVAISCG